MKNAENTWIGWVEDSEGYMIRFIGPTGRYGAQRRVENVVRSLGSGAGDHAAMQLHYAARTKFANFGHANSPYSYLSDYYLRLPIADLKLLISVMQSL